jgi:hypothetical protein
MVHINVDSGNDQNAGKLEQVIDSCGLLETVLAVALICEAKALHIESAWQDKLLAKSWQRAAEVLHRAAATKSVADVS